MIELKEVDKMDISNITVNKIKKLLEKNIRLDGRKPFEFREIIIEKDVSINAEGSARVRIGKTEVIAGVKLGVQTPYPDGPGKGTLTVGMEFSSTAGARHENGPPQIDSIEIARVVDRGIRESGFIDWDKLCIVKGEKVWNISIDIYCINDDGNALDASSLAAVVALRLTRFPVYDEETGISFGEFTDKKLPLTDHVPFALTLHKVGNGILADPNRKEEDSSEARLTLAYSHNGKENMINSMQKGGIIPLSGEEFIKVVDESEKVYEHIFPKIDKQIKQLTK